MTQCYLEVTYRKGRALAAYYYLPRRNGDTSARTEKAAEGLGVDLAADGRPIGIEITSPGQFDLAGLNQVLVKHGQPPAGPEEFAPLVAA
jgi:hypothetical protein